jgi:predicted glycosyltransferase
MIWVDVTNPPHVLFFREFITSHETLVTSRDFGDLGAILDSCGIEHTPVGRHGGKSKEEKLIESSKRVEELAGVVSNKVDVAVSKQSVELPRVAFGLGVPAIQFVDNEHAEKQNRIVLPLCRKIIVPSALNVDKLITQGAAKEQIVKVDCTFEATQIKNFKPNPDVPKAHGLEDYIVIRPEPYTASYFDGNEMTGELLKRLEGKYQAVMLPRGDEKHDAMTLRNVDSLSLMYYARAVLSGGGTMTREAALLGTPSISYYPHDLLGVDEFLIENELLHHSTNIDEIISMLEDTIDRKEETRKKANDIVNRMENPFEKLEAEINNLTGQSS